jgi:hypothetical protein
MHRKKPKVKPLSIADQVQSATQKSYPTSEGCRICLPFECLPMGIRLAGTTMDFVLAAKHPRIEASGYAGIPGAKAWYLLSAFSKLRGLAMPQTRN